MDSTTIFLAQLLGISYGVVGLALLFNYDSFEKVIKDLFKNKGLTWLAGLLTLVAGAAMVLHHNIWEGNWVTILVTVFAWAALLKGVFYVIVPEFMEKWAKAVLKLGWLQYGSVVVIALSLCFIYAGFLV
jgi:hypothetical protein